MRSSSSVVLIAGKRSQSHRSTSASVHDVTMPTLNANGMDIEYIVDGDGPPLILLHAATSSAAQDWNPQRAALRQHFTLYLPDARSHAGTVWDTDDGWTYEMLVDDAIAFADGLGLERFHLGGLSMGAGTALALAIRHPERVHSAIIAAVGVESEPRTSVARKIMQPDQIERDDPSWAQRMSDLHDPRQGQGAWRKLMIAIREDIEAATLPTPDELRRVRLPVLLAYGDRDPWVPLEQAVQLKRQLPDARLLVSPGVGHVVTAERPAVFNQAATAFLRLSSNTDA
jgi:pimeloyl-ACP methyl ester carboxylesterase